MGELGWRNTDQRFNINVSDGWSTIQKIEMSEDNENWTVLDIDYANGATADSYPLFDDERPLSDVYFRGTDSLGNVGNTKTVKFGIDKTAPKITVTPELTSSPEWRNSSVSVKITHSDKEGGSGVATTSGEYFLSKSASPTSVPTGSSLKGKDKSVTAIEIHGGRPGEYY